MISGNWVLWTKKVIWADQEKKKMNNFMWKENSSAEWDINLPSWNVNSSLTENWTYVCSIVLSICISHTQEVIHS